MQLCRGGLGEREGAIDDRPEVSAEKELRRARELAFRAHVRPHERKLPREEEPEIDLRVVAGRGAARNQAAAARQALDAAIPGRRADVLEDDVDAAIAGQPPDLGGQILRVMIDDVGGADFTRARQFFVSAGGGKYAGAVQHRNLDGRLADAAPRREHQHVITRTNGRSA